MAEVVIPTLGDLIDTDNWDVKGVAAECDGEPFLLLVDGAAMDRARQLAYATSRVGPTIWSKSEKEVLAESASLKLFAAGMPESRRLRLERSDLP